MRVVMVQPAAGTTFPEQEVCAALARNGIQVLRHRIVNPLLTNSVTVRWQRILRRWQEHAAASYGAHRLASYKRALHDGDVLWLQGLAALQGDAQVLELARSGRFRVLLWLADAQEAQAATEHSFARRYVDTVLTPDDTTRRAAQPVFSDARVLDVAAQDFAGQVRRACYPTIRIYGLFYRFLDIFEQTVAALHAHTDLNFQLFVAENYSAESERNRAVIRRYVEEGQVAGYALFRENIYGSALEHLYTKFFPPGPRDNFIVLTDLDMTLPAQRRDWLRDMLERFRLWPQVSAQAVDFDLSNWNPQVASGHIPLTPRDWDGKHGFYRVRSGLWFLALRRAMLDEYLDGVRVVGDQRIFDYFDEHYHQSVYGRLPVACRHLSWDLEATAPDYIKDKYETFYANVYRRYDCPEYEIYGLHDDSTTVKN